MCLPPLHSFLFYLTLAIPAFKRTPLLFNYLSAAANTHKLLRRARSADGSVR